jgi:MFS superfamily sulfate permease-like transporter
MDRATHAWLFASLRGFRATWLAPDLIAGMLLAAIAIPEQLATARLAGMPPETGLVTFAAGALGFAVFGANRFLSAGADSTIAPIFASGLAAIALASGVPYASLAGLLALLVGAVLIGVALLRADWIADLLSVPVITGFLAGIAVHIAVGQLPSVLGVPEIQGSLPDRLLPLLRAVPEANVYAVAIGLFVLATMQLGERIAPRFPVPLLALAVASAAVALFDLQRHGVRVIGALSTALPAPGLPLAGLPELLPVLPLALIVALVCIMQSAAVLRAFPSEPDRPEPVSRDFAGIGAGCVLAGVLGGFAVNASPPRTAVVAQSGGRSQLAALVALALTVGLALWGGTLLATVPLAALGGVLLAIAARICRVGDMARILRRGGSEIWLVAASALLVVVLPIEAGMIGAIVLSLLHSVAMVARPRCAVLARAPGTTVWWPPEHGETGEHEPGVLVFSPAAPLNFTNADFVVARLTHAVEAASPPVRLVVIEASGMAEIDYTGSLTLQQAIRALRGQGIAVALARLSSERAQAQAARTGLLETVGCSHVFRSAEEAVDAFQHRSAGPGG